MKIKSLTKHREEKVPHMTGEARCIACDNTWVAVAPLETVWLECPECGLHKGAFIYPVDPPKDTKVWTCSCKNQLFYITKKGCWCPNCGSYQSFPYVG